jgi:hypothetical protein
MGFAGLKVQDGDLGGGSFIQVYGREKRLKGYVLLPHGPPSSSASICERI